MEFRALRVDMSCGLLTRLANRLFTELELSEGDNVTYLRPRSFDYRFPQRAKESGFDMVLSVDPLPASATGRENRANTFTRITVFCDPDLEKTLIARPVR